MPQRSAVILIYTSWRSSLPCSLFRNIWKNFLQITLELEFSLIGINLVSGSKELYYFEIRKTDDSKMAFLNSNLKAVTDLALTSSVWSCSRISLLRCALLTKCAHDLVEQCQGTDITLSTLLCEMQRREFQLEHGKSRKQAPATAELSAFVPWACLELILSREMNPKCRGEICGLLSNEPCQLNTFRQGDGSDSASMTLCLVG